MDDGSPASPPDERKPSRWHVISGNALPNSPAPAPESGFWDTVGGIGIGILGGIAWVGKTVTYPLR